MRFLLNVHLLYIIDLIKFSNKIFCNYFFDIIIRSRNFSDMGKQQNQTFEFFNKVKVKIALNGANNIKYNPYLISISYPD